MSWIIRPCILFFIFLISPAAHADPFDLYSKQYFKQFSDSGRELRQGYENGMIEYYFNQNIDHWSLDNK